MGDSTDTPLVHANGTFDDAIAHYFSAIDRLDSVSISRLVAAFPEHRSELLEFVKAEKELAHRWNSVVGTGFSGPRPNQIGRFRIERRLGAGAFGVVYLAYDESLKRTVALKVPLPQAIGDSEHRRRFEAEAASAARLDHPGIVAVYEADFSGPTPYIASAYCPGPDLGRWLDTHDTPVPWREAATLMARLAEAVGYAHNSQVFHRDLKPGNVMLMPRGDSCDASANLSEYFPQLTDFGLAHCTLHNARETRSSMILGTPLYMSPERLESSRNEWPIQADIYSLGCMLYQLLTRQLPINGDTYAAILNQLRESRPVSIRKLVPGVPNDVATVCDKCLEKNPQARYGSAEALAKDLMACIEGRSIDASKPSLSTRLRYWGTRPQRIYEAGLYTLFVQALIAIWLSFAVLSATIQLVDTAAVPKLVRELLVVNFLVHIPMAVVGWQTMRRKAWAIYTGLGLTFFNLILPIVFISLHFPLFFADIYDQVDASGYFMGTTCALVFLSEVGQLVLYSAAVTACRHTLRLRKNLDV